MPFPRTVWLLLLVAAIPAGGFIRNERRAGVPLFVAAPDAVQYRVHVGTLAGLINTAGDVIITADSTPTGAILAAFETWSRVDGSLIQFLPPKPEADGTARPEGVNLITFADTPSNQAITFGAIAVTRLFSADDGAFVDTDVIFNSGMPFSTTLEPGTFDIQGALTHELGHALGMDHSGAATATMFATTIRASKRLRSLTEDDRAFLHEVYPAEPRPAAGAIEGVVRSEAGGVVVGAIVTAFDPQTNAAVSAISGIDGTFRIPQLRTGSYGLVVEPLDGPATTAQLSFLRRGARTSFRTSIPGGAANPAMTAVSDNGTAQVELQIEDGEAAYNLIGLSAVEPGREAITRSGAVLERGGVYEASLDGEGLDDPAITFDSLRLLGAGIEILPMPFERDEVVLTDGNSYPRLHFVVRVAEDAPLGVVSLALSTAAGMAAFTSGFEIVEPSPAPSYSGEGVVNAATFFGGAMAPGSLASIFGESLSTATATGFVDPVTGRVVDQLAGTTVRFNGKPAALLFVSPGQINLQAPVDLAPGPATLTVDRDGVRGPETLVETASSSPGLFSRPGGGALAILFDGSLNSPQRPVRRGGFLSLFGVGAGAVSPALELGELAPASPLSFVDGLVEVRVGGLAAEASFAGMAPGFAGLLQLNVKIPEDAPVGVAVPMLVRINGVAAPLTTLSIE